VAVAVRILRKSVIGKSVIGKRITVDSDYFALHRIPAIVQGREIGKIFAEAKDNLVVIAGKNKKEHEYLIPKSKVSHYDDKKVYLNILDSSLKEFEV
jgi:hypothetical protein